MAVLLQPFDIRRDAQCSSSSYVQTALEEVLGELSKQDHETLQTGLQTSSGGCIIFNPTLYGEPGPNADHTPHRITFNGRLMHHLHEEVGTDQSQVIAELRKRLGPVVKQMVQNAKIAIAKRKDQEAERKRVYDESVAKRAEELRKQQSEDPLFLIQQLTLRVEALEKQG